MPNESADGTEQSTTLSSESANEGTCTRCGYHGSVWPLNQPAEIVLELDWGYCWLCLDCWQELGRFFDNESVGTETDRPPELPVGLSVFTPQGTDTPVLRTPDGNYRMDPERARDLGRLLLARTEPETERRGSQ